MLQKRARKAAESKRAKPKAGKKPKAKSSAAKVRAYRARKRKAGMRLVQFWVPDMNSPEFIAEAHRQSLAVAKSPTAAEDQAWVDSVSSWNDLTEDSIPSYREPKKRK